MPMILTTLTLQGKGQGNAGTQPAPLPDMHISALGALAPTTIVPSSKCYNVTMVL